MAAATLPQIDDRRPCVTCSRCGRPYDELENYGSWQCSQHARPIDEDGVYRCCGKKAPVSGYNGCVWADHTSKPDDYRCDAHRYRESDDVVVPRGDPSYDHVLYEAVICQQRATLAAEPVFVVRRFDWKARS